MLTCTQSHFRQIAVALTLLASGLGFCCTLSEPWFNTFSQDLNSPCTVFMNTTIFFGKLAYYNIWDVAGINLFFIFLQGTCTSFFTVGWFRLITGPILFCQNTKRWPTTWKLRRSKVQVLETRKEARVAMQVEAGVKEKRRKTARLVTRGLTLEILPTVRLFRACVEAISR